MAPLVLWSALALALLLGVAAPAAVLLAARWKRRIARRSPPPAGPAALPSLTVLVVAANAEQWILERLRWLLASDYPADRFEIVVVCGPEGDLTPEVARTVDDRRVRVIQPRRGMPAAEVLTSLLETLRGDLVLYADCDVTLDRLACRKLAASFADPSLGVVCAPVNDGFRSDGPDAFNLAGALAAAGSELGLYVPVTAGVTVARRSLCRFVPGTSAFDPMPVWDAARRSEFRIEYLAEELGERRTADIEAARIGWQAWKRRGLRLLDAIRKSPSLRRPFRLDVAAFWLLHVGLWLCPILMLLALAANLSLSADPWYLRMLLVQESVYLAALMLLKRLQKSPCDALAEAGGQASPVRGSHA